MRRRVSTPAALPTQTAPAASYARSFLVRVRIVCLEHGTGRTADDVAAVLNALEVRGLSLVGNYAQQRDLPNETLCECVLEVTRRKTDTMEALIGTVDRALGEWSAPQDTRLTPPRINPVQRTASAPSRMQNYQRLVAEYRDLVGEPG